MEMSTKQKVETYIKAELGDSMLYRELADIAPNNAYRTLLLEFANDEMSHADTFQKLYKILYGKAYQPQIEPPVINAPFADMLRERILDESGDYRKYAEQISQTKYRPLQNAYYKAHLDENVHALRLLYMLQ